MMAKLFNWLNQSISVHLRYASLQLKSVVSVLMLAALASQHISANADLAVYDLGVGGLAAGVTRDPSKLTNRIASDDRYAGIWSNATMVVACQKTGFWALAYRPDIVTKDQTRYAGACGFKNRLLAKQAAINGCKQKPTCSSGLNPGAIVLISGSDDGKFDVVNHPLAWGTFVVNTSQFSPKFEYCWWGQSPQTQTVDGVCKTFKPTEKLETEQEVSFDPSALEESPWDG